jgi:hypothetical protein
MTPQTVAVIGTIISFVAGILASRGIISKDTADYLGGPETLAFIGAVSTVAVGAYALWRNRPHGIIQDAAALPQVDAVVTKPKTAGEIPVANVVGSVEAASRVPGITQG